MAKEVLTHSERYVRKTNRIILIIGIITLFVFLFGILLLGADSEEVEDQYVPDSGIQEETNIAGEQTVDNNPEIEFDEAPDVERPITMAPNPVNMGQVVLGNEASNVITIGTNGKSAIKILSVDLEDAPFEGFSYETNCKDKELRGKTTCMITMKWLPTVAANVQNNFKIVWHETNVTGANAKHDEVSVFGSSVHKEDCNFCDTGVNGNAGANVITPDQNVRYAVGPDGKIIGVIDEDGIVRDANGNEIGRVDSDGMVLDKDGNIIGVASTNKLILDENGNVIGYVDAQGVAHDKQGNVIGTMLADGTIVDAEGNLIGKAVDYGYIYDDNGNIIGRVLEDGTAVDLDGNVIGKIDDKGNVIDAQGRVIGHVSKSGEVIFDEQGNPIGIVMPNGDIVNENGDVIGRIDENGNAVAVQKIGKRGSAAQMITDENGNIIGYVKDGKAYDFNGNEIGTVDAQGNVIDKNGKRIGQVTNTWRDLAIDENGKVIGYVDSDGTVRTANGDIVGYMNDKGEITGQITDDGTILAVKEKDIVRNAKGEIIGIRDANGKIRSFGMKIIGTIINKNLLPIAPDGKVLGVINNRGEVVDAQQKVVGKMRPNGMVTDISGAKIIALGVQPGYVVNWGCDISLKLDKDGVVRQDDVDTKNRVYPDGTVWSEDGHFVGRTMMTGSVYDNECQYIGEANADGYVRDVNKKEVGCLNPDGTVLDLEEPRIKGHLVYPSAVMSSNWQKLGVLDANGTLKDSSGDLIGCVDGDGDVYDRNMAYLGTAVNAKYAFDFNGKLMGVFDQFGNVSMPNVDRPQIFMDNLIADKSMRIVGFAAPEISIFVDAEGRKIGHLFPDGNIYDATGAVVERLNGATEGYYGGKAGKLFKPSYVVDMDGRLLGKVNYDLNVFDFKGSFIGRVDAKGQMFDEKGRQVGGVVQQGAARSYNGVYLGYAVKQGRVVELEDVQDGDGKRYHKGEITGYVVPDGHVMNNGQIVGEVIPATIVADVFGQYAGFSNDHGVVIGRDGKSSTVLLPGGSSVMNHVPMKTGFVIDFSGKLIGKVLPTGMFVDLKNVEGGRVLADGKVISGEGKFLGEVLEGDVVIGNDDRVKGILGFDGNVYAGGNVIGHAITDGLAVDKQNNVIGRIFTIGNTILSSRGMYIGRLAANGRVLDLNNREVGFIKSNGSYVDADKKVTGYSLPEVARNRRN
ncbi:MAG: DUF3659 domain-containing protein [Alphaproteobacteria bacterium]|nr:DUF3659 domain-containing protein [Alphaproteobacteria bacterium]